MDQLINKKCVFAISIFILSFSGFTQDKDSLIYFSGKITSFEGNYPVALAHVINLNQHWMVKADTLGNFQIWANIGDTLHVSAIGFEYLEYSLKKAHIDSIIQVNLQNKTYDIPEASIIYLGSYKDFEYKVLNLELPDLGVNPQAEKLFKHVEFELVTEPVITSPASLIYSLFSKDAKEIKKYLEIKENQDQNEELDRRYNTYIIQNLTGLQGMEAKKFMEFCNFKDLYILSISDYSLYSEILMRFNEYKKNMNSSEKPD